MKKLRISRLFHWLYASLMLAPVFAIGISCLTHVFNKENGVYEKPRYESLVYKESYVEDFLSYGPNKYIGADLANYDDMRGSDIYTQYLELILNDGKKYIFYAYDTYFLRPWWRVVDELVDFTLYYYDDDTSEQLAIYYTDEYSNIKYLNYLVPNYETTEYFGFAVGSYVEVSSELIPKDITNINSNNIFYESVSKAMNSTYFSWAKESFLVEPFKFIGNLFSVPNDNPIYLLLSYWLDISLIWLVFDLIMYVPLLVHSWLDNASIGG